MKFTVLKINKLPLYIPSDKVGVVSICNNKDGTEFHCYEKDSIDEKRRLHIGDRLYIQLISLCSTNVPSKFKLPNNSIKKKYSDNYETISDGMEIIMGDTMINTPFIKGGVQSVLITVNKGECYLKVGGMTPDNELLDYYYSMLSVGDNISVSLKNLTQISKPICKRPFKGCDYRNEIL